MAVRFIELNKDNLLLASLIQYKIFYLASCYDDYKNFVEKKAKDRGYYLVYADSEPVGVAGFSKDKIEKDMFWVNWIGILPQFRGNGYGRQILEGMLAMIKQKGGKFARLYTSRKWNINAQFLYKKVMDLEEPYKQEGKDFEHYVVFSKSLCDKPVQSFGDRNLHIKEAENYDTKGIEHLKKYLNSFVYALNNKKDGKLFDKLLSSDLITSFQMFERKPKQRMLQIFDEGHYVVKILKVNDTIWAYAILCPGANNFCLLDYFAVTKEYRNIGIGKMFLEDICGQEDNIVIELEPFDWNDPKNVNTRRANFYKKCGFTFPNFVCTLHNENTYILAVKSKEKIRKKDLQDLYKTIYRPCEFKIEKK